MHRIKSIILLFLCTLLFVACEQTTTTVVLSSDAKLASFSLRANDSIPALSTAVFTIDEPEDTGRVYNVDSLPYLTRIDSVSPYFRFNSTPALARAFFPNGDSLDLSGTDTLNFTAQPVKLFVVAADMKATRWYNIYINVHQINPDLYTWRQMSAAIAGKDIEQQKALWFGGRLLWFVKDAVGTDIYESSDGSAWSMLTDAVPHHLSISSVITYKDMITAAGTDGSIYYTTDVTGWTKIDLDGQGISCENIVAEYADSLWLIVRGNTDNVLHLATTKDFGDIRIHSEPLPSDFPVEGFASASFPSSSYRPRLIVIGGYSADGVMLDSRWSAEKAGDEIRWTNYSQSRKNFNAVAGAQVVYYNNMLLMLGGLTENNTLLQTDICQSVDEGLSWSKADSANNALPATFTPRYSHSMFSDDDNTIYVVGGKSLTEHFSDVYSGKLGSMDFEE